MYIISRLIQCAIDGFNVCIFAYGHTGSGKTFTMVGDRDRRNLGLIPRTFTRIFEIIQDNESKFEFKVLLHLSFSVLSWTNVKLVFKLLFFCPFLRFQPTCWSCTMTDCRISLWARLKLSTSELKLRGTERGLCSPRELRQRTQPALANSLHYSSRVVQTATLQPQVRA